MDYLTKARSQTFQGVGNERRIRALGTEQDERNELRNVLVEIPGTIDRLCFTAEPGNDRINVSGTPKEPCSRVSCRHYFKLQEVLIISCLRIIACTVQSTDDAKFRRKRRGEISRGCDQQQGR